MTNRSLATHVFSFSCLVFLAACNNAGSSTEAPHGGLPITYRSPDGQFSVRHPDGWNMEENHVLTTNDYEATGTALLAPTDRTKTTLYEGIFHVAKMDTCPISLNDEVTMNGQSWRHDTWNGAGAGNLYEGETYATETEGSCLVVTLYAHSCNLSPEECGPTKPQKYDKGALFGTMHQMIETLKLL
jgi:hypothetical protein